MKGPTAQLSTREPAVVAEERGGAVIKLTVDPAVGFESRGRRERRLVDREAQRSGVEVDPFAEREWISRKRVELRVPNVDIAHQREKCGAGIRRFFLRL